MALFQRQDAVVKFLLVMAVFAGVAISLFILRGTPRETGTTERIGGKMQAEKATRSNSSWQVHVETDPITDKRNLTARIQEDNPATDILSRPVELFVRVSETGGYSLGLVGSDVPLEHRTAVQMRFDDSPSESIPWHWSGTTALCLRDGREMFNRVKDSQKLTIRYKILGGRTRTASFNLNGLLEAIATNDTGGQIGKLAEQIAKESQHWAPVGKGAIVRVSRDAWSGLSTGVSPAALLIRLNESGSIQFVAVNVGETILPDTLNEVVWRIKIDSGNWEKTNWRPSGESALYAGQAVDLVRRLQRAKTLQIDLHAGLNDSAILEWNLDGLTAALDAARH